jgi:hypothetical protein
MIRIVTAYTPDYAELALRLRDSAKAFGVPISAVPYESRGSWAKNHLFKPQAILRVMTETGDDCLWLDADMYLRDWPSEWPAGDVLLKFSDPPEAQVFDFNALMNFPNKHGARTPWGGHMLWRNTHLSREVIKNWQQHCEWYSGLTNDEQCLMLTLAMVFNPDVPLITGHGEFAIGPFDPYFIVHTPAGREHGKPTADQGWL